ncbi:MAG: TIGR02996 domain-containing protein [Myxococcota bacterium]
MKQIQAHPWDDLTRAVYADWLEASGDGRAEIVRLQTQLHKMVAADAHPGATKPVRRRLNHLTSEVDLLWLVKIDPTKIDACDPKFEFECPKAWAMLEPTDDPLVRHCHQCSQKVYYCLSVRQAHERARWGQCVAVRMGPHRRPGDIKRGRRRRMGRIAVR